MGWWKTRNGTIGDPVADVVDRMFREVEDVYLKEVGRLPTQGEIGDVVEFCSSGVFKVECGDSNYVWTTFTSHDDDTPRAAKRGDQGAFGESATPPKGCLANVDPTTGQHWKKLEDGDIDRCLYD